MTAAQDPIDELIARYLPRLYSFVRIRMGALLRSRESSSDLVQSVCRELLERRERFEVRDEVAFSHWLFETAFRKIQDRVRYHGAQKRSPAKESSKVDDQLFFQGLAQASFADPAHQAEFTEELERFELAFEKLPPQYRDMILYSRFLGLEHQEIAERTGMTKEAVTYTLSRALARLSTLLK